MKIFNPTLVGEAQSQSSSAAPPEPASVHSHSNLAILSRLSLDEHGVLLFDSHPIDTVGQQFVNAAILEQFTVEDGKLYFAGSPVDTVGSVFSNEAVLRMFSQSAEGKLLFNGQPIEGGSTLPNAEDLARLGVNADGQLTLDGAVVGGSGGAVALSVTKLGSGTALLKGIVGSDLQTRSLVAGSNVTLDVSGDEIKINASLSGAVSASSTFTKSDDFTRSAQVISLSSASKLRAIEPSISDSGLVFQATLCDDTNASINGGALSSKGTAPTLVETSLFRNERALKCNGGCLVVPEGTTASVTAPSTWFSGTKDWCIELEFARDTSKLGTTQNLASNYTDTYANASLWIGIGTDNCPYVGIGYGTTVTQSLSIRSSVAVTDGSKHHLAVVRQGSTYTLYVDGVSRGTATSASSNNAPTYGFYLGSSVSSGSPSTQFYGYLRNVRVWNFAKYTAGFTVPAIAYPTIGDRYLTMAGKLLSASFWKQITSLSVVSTETATAYLKWLMVDSTGYYVWNSTTKAWVASDLASIASAGMTTAEVKACMSNLAWNYRSDMIGFAVAFISTDGTSAPSLTSATIAAVQSADKTAGHLIENVNQTLAQRPTLRLLGMDVVDDGARTVVTGYTDSSKFTHKGSGLDSVISDLVANKGLIGGKSVDVSSGLADGTVLAYSQTADKFKPAVPAVGAVGSGLFKTAPFTVLSGEEVTVVHQQVNDGRAVYQADQVVAGAQSSTLMRALLASDKTISGLQESYPTDSNHRLQLATSYASVAKGATGSFPIPACIGLSYVVDDYLYVVAGATTNWAAVSTIYRAPISNPTAFVSVGNTPAGFSSSNGCQVYRYKDKLYVFNGSYVYSASLDSPAVWAQVGTLPGAIIQGAAFIVGTRAYVMGGQLGSTYAPISTVYSADMSDLSTWRTETSLPTPLGRMTSYQYGDYLYLIGGETSFDSAYSNKVYRAHKDTPTAWTQIGTIPVALGSIDEPVVYNGRVFLFGGRQSTSTYSSAVYSADASNPISWASHTSLTTARQFAIKALVDDVAIIIGGFNGTWLSSTEVYSFTKTVANGLQGDCTLSQINTSLMQKIVRFELDAYIPANTSVYAAVAFDGVWNYYDAASAAWVPCADVDAALSASKSVVLNSGNLWYVQGLENFVLGAVKSVQVAFRAKNSAANVTPVLRKFAMTYLGVDSYEVLLIGRSAYADLSVRHEQGTYTKTLVKNKTSQALTMVLKVCDGTL